MPALMTLWIGPFTMRAVKAPTGVGSLKSTVNSLTLIWDPLDEIMDILKYGAPQGTSILLWDPQTVKRGSIHTGKETPSILLWDPLTVGKKTVIGKVIDILQFSFEILLGVVATHRLGTSCPLSFNSLLRSSTCVTGGGAKSMSVGSLQFSFEIFVEPEVRVVRDRVLKTLQFSFEILK